MRMPIISVLLLLLLWPETAEAQLRQLHFEEVTIPLIGMPDDGHSVLHPHPAVAGESEWGGITVEDGERSLWRYPLIGAGVGAAVVIGGFLLPFSPFYGEAGFDDGLVGWVLGVYAPIGALFGGLVGVGMNAANTR